MGQYFFTMCPADALCGNERFETLYDVDESNYIGTGKFSIVHLCWRRNQPEKRYALKVITTHSGDNASLNRTRDEIHILKVLGNHPSIIQLIDMDESHPNRIRLVLELCEGGELYDRIQHKQFYPEHEGKILMRNLFEAVTYIHTHGIMHRDLKPENILLASKVSSTDIKISDFGLAKLSKDYPRRYPRSHSICGSDFYLAPEVIKQEEYGREIDIWSGGVVAYVVLSGSLPFFNNVLHKLYRQIVERDLTFPESNWRLVSRGAQDFIVRLLQARPGDRMTADRALHHPWLRNTSSPLDSFNTQCSDSLPQQPNQFNSQSMSARKSSSRQLHPLEHAHKVHSTHGSLRKSTAVDPRNYNIANNARRGSGNHPSPDHWDTGSTTPRRQR